MKIRFFERGGLWVAAQTVLMAAVIVLSLACPAVNRDPTLLFLGLFMAALGAYLGLAGVWALRRNITPFPAPLPEARLVRHGIYAHIRHPLYASVILVCLGWALAWQSWPGLAVACLQIPFFEAKSRREEKWLREQFGEYATYAQTTRRFIPWMY
jgi:protein-S-isoprenylcysteine O-methyltransferase Ste14